MQAGCCLLIPLPPRAKGDLCLALALSQSRCLIAPGPGPERAGGSPGITAQNGGCPWLGFLEETSLQYLMLLKPHPLSSSFGLQEDASHSPAFPRHDQELLLANSKPCPEAARPTVSFWALVPVGDRAFAQEMMLTQITFSPTASLQSRCCKPGTAPGSSSCILKTPSPSSGFIKAEDKAKAHRAKKLEGSSSTDELKKKPPGGGKKEAAPHFPTGQANGECAEPGRARIPRCTETGSDRGLSFLWKGPC